MPLKWDLIEEKTKTHSSPKALKALFKKATIWFSLSFFVSAILNFALALFIFKESAEDMNKKIADMTWLGFVVIGLPLTLFSAFCVLATF